MSRNTIRRLVAASLVVTGAATVAACSGGSDGSGGSGGSGDGSITLWTHNGGNDAELAIDEKIVADFNASQDEYTVELQSFPQASYNDAVVAAASAKKLPCIVDIDAPNVPNWAWAGYLAPLDLPEETFDGQLESTVGTVDGQVYTYGHYDVALAMYSRRSVLESVGARIPTTDAPWTEQELADVLADLEATGQFPYPLDLGTGGTGEWLPYAYSPFLQSFGGDLVDRETYTSAEGVLNGPEAVAWGEWMQGLVADGSMSARSGSDATADFVNGQSGILYSGSWANASVTEAFGDDAVVLPPPDLGEGPKIGGGSWQWGMTSGCSDPAAAQAYLDFALQSDYVVELADTLGVIPATDEAAAAMPDYAEGGKAAVFRDMSKEFALVRPVTPAYPFISSTFQKAVTDILSGGDVQQILDKAAADIDTDIQRNDDYAF